MKVKIWYMNEEGWLRFGSTMIGHNSLPPGSPAPDRPTLATLEDTHVLLMTLDRDEITQVRKEGPSINDVFVAMQGENWSPKGEARPLIKEKGLRHTSMSVGDVLEYGDSAYIVACEGFELIQ